MIWFYLRNLIFNSFVDILKQIKIQDEVPLSIIAVPGNPVDLFTTFQLRLIYKIKKSTFKFVFKMVDFANKMSLENFMFSSTEFMDVANKNPING